MKTNRDLFEKIAISIAPAVVEHFLNNKDNKIDKHELIALEVTDIAMILHDAIISVDVSDNEKPLALNIKKGNIQTNE